jgi:hypothetical protein
MMYAQYYRLESKAGGVSCSNREFIRACLSVIKKRYRFDHSHRVARHAWLREGLTMLVDARRMALKY